MALFKYFSWVLKLPFAEYTNIGVEPTKSVNGEVQHVMEDTESRLPSVEVVNARFTPHLRLSEEQALAL